MNENEKNVYDRDGLICNCGDILYDKKGLIKTVSIVRAY